MSHAKQLHNRRYFDDYVEAKAQPGPVEHPALELFLDIALLTRRQCGREYDQVSVVVPLALFDFLEFAFADEGTRIRAFSRAYDLVDNNGPCGAGKLYKFFAF